MSLSLRWNTTAVKHDWRRRSAKVVCLQTAYNALRTLEAFIFVSELVLVATSRVLPYRLGYLCPQKLGFDELM